MIDLDSSEQKSLTLFFFYYLAPLALDRIKDCVFVSQKKEFRLPDSLKKYIEIRK